MTKFLRDGGTGALACLLLSRQSMRPMLALAALLVSLALVTPAGAERPTASTKRVTKATKARSGASRSVKRRTSGSPSTLASARTSARLVALGYSPAVAQQLVSRAPEMAQRILAAKPSGEPLAVETPVNLRGHGSADGRPLRLYRGVAHDLAHYDLSFQNTRIPGLLFFSEQITEPHRYAWGGALNRNALRLAAGETKGTIVELEVPSFLVFNYGHPVLRTDDVPDLSLFVSRVAEVDLTRAYFPVLAPSSLTWSGPEVLAAARTP